MEARGERESDALTDALFALRPEGPAPSSLEQRLAVASILAASGLAADPVRLGRLEVQSRIGGGGMGVVYRAWDPELERLVAVKLLRGYGEAAERTRVAGEARALARLSHPNVVAIYDILDEAGELCFVMEHVAGATLREWLAAHPEADWREVLGWFVQAGRGVVAAHTAGLVHGDVKPENILVGDDGRARVLDFGLARWSLDEELGLAGGTPRYTAPEVAPDRPATARSDQYSFCVALQEALDGKGAPQVLVRAIARGVAPDPDARHESLAGLLDVLEHALESPAGDRPRALLLERVKRLWLDGVLDRSLDGGAAVELTLESAPELVEPPSKRWGIDAGAGAPTRSQELMHALEVNHGSLLVVGPPGSGKTTLLLGLCRELWRTARLVPEEPAPVVLSLSTYHPETRAGRSLGEHFARWIVDELVAKYGLARPAVRGWLETAGIVLLLDGLDETDPQLRDRVVETLNQLRESHGLSMVVTCRDSEYEALGRRLAFGGALRVLPLEDASMTALIESRHAASLMAQLARDDRLRSHLRNPLLLTLLVSGGSLDDGSDAPGWSRAYERYVEHALGPATEREREQLPAQLRFLAGAMRRHSTSDLWLERLHFGWLERRWEQLAAYAMGVVVVLLLGIGLNVTQVPITGNSLVSALTFGVGVSLSSFAYTRGRIKPVESLRWSWRRMLRLLPVTTVCATVIGLAEALRVHFAANLVGAGITGALLAVTFALDASDRPTKVRPNEGIRRSLSFALVTSFGFGVPAGLLFGLVVDPYLRQPLIEGAVRTENASLMAGVSVGLFVFTALFLIYGGFTVLMHAVLRLWLAWRTPLPLALPRLLDRAVELRLMRRVGGGYVFLHRTLLDYFADGARGRG